MTRSEFPAHVHRLANPWVGWDMRVHNHIKLQNLHLKGRLAPPAPPPTPGPEALTGLKRKA